MAGAITDLLDRVTDSNTSRPVISSLASPGKSIGAPSINLSDVTAWTTSSKVHFSIYKTQVVGGVTIKDPTTQTDWVGTLAGSVISNLTLTGGTDRAYVAGDIVELTPTARMMKDLYDWAIAQHKQDGSHSNITADSITDNGTLLSQVRIDTITNFVVSGGIVAISSGFVGTFSDIVYYIAGRRYTKTTVANKTYTASKDTYLDIDINGNITYTEVTNGAAAPALAANNIRLGKVVTSGAAITSIVQNDSDSLGNPMRPRGPISTNQVQSSCAFRMYRTAALNSPAGTTGAMAFDTKEFDLGNNCNTTTGAFTVPFDGIYSLTGHVSLGSANTGIFIVLIGKNGGDLIRGVDIRVNSTNKSGMVSETVKLAAGDVITIRVFTDVSVAHDVTAPAALNTFSGHLVSRL